MFSVDFHCHTIYSKDSLTRPESLIAASHKRKLDRVVITDHNTIAGAIAASALDPELVIIGEEIMTTQGEILATYVTDEILPGLSPKETITCLRDQGAFISISHPFDFSRRGAWKLEDLLEITPLVDAIEIFNARSITPYSNRRSLEFAHQYDLAGTAGSDAHTTFELGAATMVLPQFVGPDELKIVICEGKVHGHLSPLWVHLFSRYAHLHKKVV